MNLKQLRYPSIALLLVAGLWLGWPQAPEPAAPDAGKNAPGPRSSNGGNLVQQGTGSEPAATRPATRVRDRSAAPSKSAGVDGILANNRISNEVAANLLHDLAVNPALPLEERLEALGHGLNLDITPFARFAETPELPASLANEFLDSVINSNDKPGLQIQTYLALLDHPDPEVSESATEMLAFAVGDDLGEANRSTLIRMAEEKLAKVGRFPDDSR